MKRLLIIGVVAAVIYSCDKETDVVYDSHLFQALQANSWIFDSSTVTDSLGKDTLLRANDSVREVNQFNSQLYTVRNVKIISSDTTVLDTVSNQIIYNSPNRIYFYNTVSQQIISNQYMDIDTVNMAALIVTKTDTNKNVARIYYHAQ